MRKLFKTLVFTSMFAMASLVFNIAHAEDVWVYGNSEYSVYAITETYNRLPSPANFKINAKVVYKNGEYTTNSYLFSREGYGGKGAVSTWYCIVNDSDRYLLDLDNPANNTFPYHVNLFRFCVKKFQS